MGGQGRKEKKTCGGALLLTQWGGHDQAYRKLRTKKPETGRKLLLDGTKRKEAPWGKGKEDLATQRELGGGQPDT